VGWRRIWRKRGIRRSGLGGYSDVVDEIMPELSAWISFSRGVSVEKIKGVTPVCK
jgi:hypothetical protein